MAFAVTNTFTANTTAEAAKVNTNFSEIETELNDFPTDGALGTGVVDTTQLAADAVTNAKIADDALDSEHYTDGSIDAAHLASDSVTNAKIDTSGAFSLFGTWTANDSGSNAIVKTEVYKAGTDGFITVQTSAGTNNIKIYTDSSNPPTTLRIYQDVTGSGKESVMCPIKKDDYFKVTGTYVTPIYWLPIGTGTVVKQ